MITIHRMLVVARLSSIHLLYVQLCDCIVISLGVLACICHVVSTRWTSLNDGIRFYDNFWILYELIGTAFSLMFYHIESFDKSTWYTKWSCMECCLINCETNAIQIDMFDRRSLSWFLTNAKQRRRYSNRCSRVQWNDFKEWKQHGNRTTRQRHRVLCKWSHRT